MDGQMNGQQHGGTRNTPPSQQNFEEVPGVLSEGLDVFDLQLRNDCANVPSTFMSGMTVNGTVGMTTGLSPSPTLAMSAVMFSSVATATHGLASTMSNPQTTRCMVRDVAQVILRYISANGEPQPENLSDDYERQLILQFVDELQRLTAAPPTGVTSGGDGRWTIDKEVVLSLKNSREGLPPPGAEVIRPHHPYVGYCGTTATTTTNNTSPRLTTQSLLRGTPPNVGNPVHCNTTASNMNNNIARSVYSAIDTLSPSGMGTTTQHQTGLTATSLSRRVGGGDVIRPRPQLPRNGGRGIVAHRRLMTSTKKVLRSASSAFSEFSAGETGEVSSSMSRTTVGTSTLAK